MTKIAPYEQFQPLALGPERRVFVLTGAGVSQEAGSPPSAMPTGSGKVTPLKTLPPQAWSRIPSWFGSSTRRDAPPVEIASQTRGIEALETMQERVGQLICALKTSTAFTSSQEVGRSFTFMVSCTAAAARTQTAPRQASTMKGSTTRFSPSLAATAAHGSAPILSGLERCPSTCPTSPERSGAWICFWRWVPPASSIPPPASFKKPRYGALA